MGGQKFVSMLVQDSLLISVSDPHALFADLDPAFWTNVDLDPIPDQDPNPGLKWAIFLMVQFFICFHQRTFYDELAVFCLSYSPQVQPILHLLDPDPHSEYRSRRPIKCRSNADLDLKHCYP
jgi:hypothetical protein